MTLSTQTATDKKRILRPILDTITSYKNIIAQTSTKLPDAEKYTLLYLLGEVFDKFQNITQIPDITIATNHLPNHKIEIKIDDFKHMIDEALKVKEDEFDRDFIEGKKLCGFNYMYKGLNFNFDIDEPDIFTVEQTHNFSRSIVSDIVRYKFDKTKLEYITPENSFLKIKEDFCAFDELCKD